VSTYAPRLGTGIPLLYERGAGLVNTIRLSSGAGVTLFGAQAAADWLAPPPAPEERICK